MVMIMSRFLYDSDYIFGTLFAMLVLGFDIMSLWVMG